MRKLFVLAFLVAVVAVGWLAWSFFFPSAEQRIRQQMTSLAETATFPANASVILRAAKAQRLLGQFTPDAQAMVDLQGIGSRTFTSRDEMSDTLTAMFGGFRSLRVQFLDVTIKVAADRRTADVSCTAKVFIGTSKDYGVEELHFQFRQVEGRWLICKVETVKTLT